MEEYLQKLREESSLTEEQLHEVKKKMLLAKSYAEVKSASRDLRERASP